MSHEYTEFKTIDNKVHIFYIGFDLLDIGYAQAKHKFYDELFNDIPYFAFGPDVLEEKVKRFGIVPTMREALLKIYSIKEITEARYEYIDSKSLEDKYIKRGEFGELLLYHILHEYFNADALISKIYFKDSESMSAHGFDAVHVDVEKKLLWLGESKLYIDKNKAIVELVNDVKSHFKTDFLRSEFQIITNRLYDSKKEYDDFILNLLDPNTKILDKVSNINISLFAGYESECLKNFNREFFEISLKSEIDMLRSKADVLLKDHIWNDKLNIFLFFFPLDDKRDFVASLHKKLMGAQNI